MSESVKERRSSAPLTGAEKAAIVVLKAQGMSDERIAEKMGRSRRCIWGHVQKMKKSASTVGVEMDWKADMKIRAVEAVNSGLDATEDPYKRGNLGVRALVGLQEFAPDGAQVQVNQLMGSVPPEFRERYERAVEMGSGSTEKE